MGTNVGLCTLRGLCPARTPACGPQTICAPSATILDEDFLDAILDIDNRRNPARSSMTRCNPSRSTLPPPLELPIRQPGVGTVSHLFKVGKTYLGFYKEGFKSVFANRKLLKGKLALVPRTDQPSIFKPHHVPATFSRADWILLWRTRHDVARLPVFGITVLAVEELTPLIAYFVEGIMPLTCRGPQHSASQETRRWRGVSTRWKNSSGRIPTVSPRRRPHGHISCAVLTSSVVFGIALDSMPPGRWQLKGRSQMGFLEGDDKLPTEGWQAGAALRG